MDQYELALAKAKAENKPLFIDFTGVYCANCRVMERRVFPTKPVKEQFDKMELYIYQGTLIKSQPFSQTLDLNNCPAGIYLLKLVDEKSIFTTLVLKN